MADLIKAGEFVGRGEEPTARHFESALPKSWTVICNKELVDPRGEVREVDFIVIGDRCVFVIDEKSWCGDIYGNDNGWVLPSGESYLNPLGKVGFLARRLAGMLRDNVPLLRKSLNDHFVFPRVVMSSSSVSVRVNDPRVKNEVLVLESSHEYLQRFDRSRPDESSIGRFRRQIRESLVALHNRPKIPRFIAEYEVTESLEGSDTYRLLRAVHEDGTHRFLRLVRAPTTADPKKKHAHRNALLREYETLKRLGAKNCSPNVDPYFTWEDRTYWVIPIHPIEGRTLRADRSGGPPTKESVLKTVQEAFRTLCAVHEEEILHRGLTPDRIFITRNGIQFSDFLIARIGGETTVVSQAAAIDPENFYWAPECRLGLELSSPASDVYSLAAALHFWITGCEGSREGAFASISDVRQDLHNLEFLDTLISQCLTEDDQERPTAAAVVRSLAIR